MSRKQEKEDALDDSCETATQLLDNAVGVLDAKFGEGYSVEHPKLVGAFMAVAFRDHASGKLNENLSAIAEYINRLGNNDADTRIGALEALGKVFDDRLSELGEIAGRLMGSGASYAPGSTSSWKGWT